MFTQINEAILKEHEIFGLGNVKEIKLGSSFAVVVTDTKTISLFETEDSDGILVGISFEDVSTDSTEEVKSVTIDTPMEISMVDICTSEGSLYFTNGNVVTVELKREEDLIDTTDYDFVVTGREVTFR
jgi:hypothetical protein